MAASWECPSLPMITLPSKETAKTSFMALKPLISAHYEENAESFNEEIKQLDQFRENAMHPPREYSGCTIIRRYFAQLHLIRVRFPPETTGQIPIDFAWKDAFSGAEYIQEGLQIEQASVLYNLSALHSKLGSHGRRDNEQEIKEAVTHFQCAAGAYGFLDEHFAINHASKDLGPEFVALYRTLMLGQAQECLVEKTLKGNGRVKNMTIAKLACRVSECYSQVIRALEAEPCSIIAKKNKDWPKLLKIKVVYFQALAHFFQGENSLETSKYGEQIAYEELALQKVNSIGKIPKNLGEVVRDAVRNFSDHVGEKLQVSRRQNEQVYHEPIPAPETLETLHGADILKPIAFHPTDLGVDIFQRLIPMRAHEVASVHSEEKAKLLRSITCSVNERDEELEQFMTSLSVGDVEKVHDQEPLKIPENVLEQHKLLTGKGEDVKKLRSDIQELMSLSGKVSEDLAYIVERKKEETQEEEKFQAQFGPRPASQVCASVWKELENYQGYHSQASKSNAELKVMFDQHYPHLLLLCGPLSSLHAVTPKLTLMDVPAEDSTDTERWRELMGKINQMRQQRSMLVKQLRDQMNSDDITKSLIGHLGSDQEAFVEERIKKHREVADVIWKNLSAQERILEAVTEANAKKVGTRHAVQEINQQRETLFASLVKSATYLGLLKSKIQEGLGFYSRIHDNVAKLRRRATDVCNARRRERENVASQKSPTPDQPLAPTPDTEEGVPPPPAPPRPPKKAELIGNVIPPEQRRLPPRAPHDHIDHPPPSPPVPDSEHHHQQPGVIAMAPTSQPMFQPQQQPGVVAVEPTSQPMLEPQPMFQPQQQPGVVAVEPPSQPMFQPQQQPGAVAVEPISQPMFQPQQQPGAVAMEPTSQPMFQPHQHPGAVAVAPSSQPTFQELQRTQQLQMEHIKREMTGEAFPVPQFPAGVLPLHPPTTSPDQTQAAITPLDQNVPVGTVSFQQVGGTLPQASLPPTEPFPQLGSAGQDVLSGLNMADLEATATASLLDLMAPSTSGQDQRASESPTLSKEHSQTLQELQRLLIPPGDGGVWDGVRSPPPSDVSAAVQGASGAGQTEVEVPGSPDGLDGGEMPLRPHEPSHQPSPVLPSLSVAQISDLGDLGSLALTPGSEHPPPSSYHPPPPQGPGDEIESGPPVPLSDRGSLSPPPFESKGQDEDVGHLPSSEGLQLAPSTRSEEDETRSPPAEIEPRAETGLTSPAMDVLPVEGVVSLTTVAPPARLVLEQSINVQPGESTITISSMSRPIATVTSPTTLAESETFVPPPQLALSAQLPDSMAGPVVTRIAGTWSDGDPSQFVAGLQQPPHSHLPLPQMVTRGQHDHTLEDSTASATTSHLASITATTSHLASITATTSHLASQDQPLATEPMPTPSLEGHNVPGVGLANLSQAEHLGVSATPPPPAFELQSRYTIPVEGNLPSLSQGPPVGGIDLPPASLQASHLPPLDVGGLALDSLNLSVHPSLLQSLPTTLQPPTSIQKDALSLELQTLQSAHLESELARQQGTIREQSSQLAVQKQEIGDQKKQILLLQQQLIQLGMQQQKQDQEKVAASGQQAALMQLLQQQQGMFSHQQVQIEKLSQLDESYRKEQHEVEAQYKQALAVEIEQKSSLQRQVLQKSQEVQQLHQQSQAQSQQTQAIQLQLQQYLSLIQERDRQLITFREQHKQIVQALDQRHQQKVAHLMQQTQELQNELKKAREQQRMHVQQLQAMPAMQVRPQVLSHGQRPMTSQPPPTLQRPLAPTVLRPGISMSQAPNSQSLQTPPPNLPPPLQPVVSQQPSGMQGLRTPPNLPPPIQPQSLPPRAQILAPQAPPTSGAQGPILHPQGMPGGGAVYPTPRPPHPTNQMPPGAVLYAAHGSPQPHTPPPPPGGNPELPSPSQPRAQTPGAAFHPGFLQQLPPTQQTHLHRQGSLQTPPPMPHGGGQYQLPLQQPQGPGVQQPQGPGVQQLSHRPQFQPGAADPRQRPQLHGVGAPPRMPLQLQPHSSMQRPFQAPTQPPTAGSPHILPPGHHQLPVTAPGRILQPSPYPQGLNMQQPFTTAAPGSQQ